MTKDANGPRQWVCCTFALLLACRKQSHCFCIASSMAGHFSASKRVILFFKVTTFLGKGLISELTCILSRSHHTVLYIVPKNKSTSFKVVFIIFTTFLLSELLWSLKLKSVSFLTFFLYWACNYGPKRSSRGMDQQSPQLNILNFDLEGKYEFQGRFGQLCYECHSEQTWNQKKYPMVNWLFLYI